MAKLQHINKDWEYRSNLGDKGAAIVADYLTEKGITAQLVRGTFKSCDIVSEKNGEMTTFEVKTYANAERYNCHWIEVFRHTEKDGWHDYGLATSNADYWVFVSETKIIFVKAKTLRNRLLIHGTKEEANGAADKRPKIVYKPTLEMLESWGKSIENKKGLK